MSANACRREPWRIAMIEKLREEINTYFVGKKDVIEDVLTCILAGGHILLEDVPGVGKTTLSKVVAKTMGLDFGRIQFTPDTLPSDVTGLSVFNMKTNEFEFHEGTVMHQIVLADEINRTTPKTQSALLEAMAEGQVSADGHILTLPDPFIVIATQNPVEFIGTYPLPEAELDRFMMKLSIGYPSMENEVLMARNYLTDMKADDAETVFSAEELQSARRDVAAVTIGDSVLGYIYNIISMTREEGRFVTGASPRAFIALSKATQARAYLNRRDFVTPDDVKAVTVNVLHHRLSLTQEARVRKEDVRKILNTILVTAKVPMK